MSARALWLLLLLFGWAFPAAATETQSAPPAAPPPAAPVAAPKEDGPSPKAMKGWVAALRTRVLQVVADRRLKLGKGTLVKLSFSVTETGRLEGIRGEGEPRAVERVAAALGKVAAVPAPPDGMAHAVTVPVRVK